MPPLDADARRQLHERLARLHQQGDYRQAHNLAERELAEDEDAASQLWLGRLCREMGKFQAAEAALLQSLSLYTAQGGKDSPEYAGSLHELGLLYDATGRFAQAEPLIRSALEARLKALGENHADTATSLHDLAALLESMGRNHDAAELRRRALTARRALGEDNPDLGLTLAAEARAACQQGQ